ncbi:MAG TPA: hypothetical protein VKT75_07995 [Acidobacteriaceae bacterium]|nr:hypothetical protein [Acidobacteriaceae bacterium]
MNEQITDAQKTEPHENHRCEHIAPSGRRCGRWASLGEELCHAHLKYAEACAGRRVDVPLLEDEASILYVLSQTAQALATGGMPPANGHAVISACKLATRILELRLKQAQWQAKHGDPESPSAQEPPAEDPEPADSESTALDNDSPLMAVSDDASDQPFVPAGQRPSDRVQARVDAAAAERCAQEGPMVRFPRFHPEDLKTQWERGAESPWNRNRNSFWHSRQESDAINQWRDQNRDLVRARQQRMLDEYFGRVKKDGTPATQGQTE